MRTIRRDQVQQLMEQGAQIVEVLEQGQYQAAHLPGAVHLPAWELTRTRAEGLSRQHPVVLYCFDSL